MLRAPYGEGGRLVVVSPDSRPRVLSGAFHSACDPEVSFDAKHILFAGKRNASDRWNIYEMAVDGSSVRQITREIGNCRSPGYQSSLYRLTPVGVPSEPWYQLTFTSDAAGTMNEDGSGPATHLYSVKLDGTAPGRLSFNLSSELDPCLMDDGRLVFAGWQRAVLDHGLRGRIGLFGVDLDGADYALFAGYEGKRIKHMPCVTSAGLLVFVEADAVPWDGAGQLARVSLRRPLHSYRPITTESDGLFHSPSPLPDGRILVARRPRDGSRTHGIWRLDPATGEADPVFDDPRYHEIQARLIHPRREPDGRSSVVMGRDPDAETGQDGEIHPNGELYCLNVYTSDLKRREWMPPGSVKRLRVLEGIPLKVTEAGACLPAAHRNADQSPVCVAAEGQSEGFGDLGIWGFGVEKSPREISLFPLFSLVQKLAIEQEETEGTERTSRVPKSRNPKIPSVRPAGPVSFSTESTSTRYPGSTVNGIPPLAQRRILGEVPVEEDGSFHVVVPANTSIELQILDANGMALRRCGWIWAATHEPRGCVGCHEDGELVPENRFVEAFERSSIPLDLPPERRRTVDFRRDVMPIIAAKCAPCHGQKGKTPLHMTGDLALLPGPGGQACFNRTYESLLVPDDAGRTERPSGKYVHPGRARTSPLVWNLFGRNTARPWDPAAERPVKSMPPAGADALTEDEKRIIVEWIDMGALWDGIPGPDHLPGRANVPSGDRE